MNLKIYSSEDWEYYSYKGQKSSEQKQGSTIMTVEVRFFSKNKSMGSFINSQLKRLVYLVQL